MKKLLTIMMLMPLLALGEEAKDGDVPNWKDETLSGDWGGLRTNLYQKGIEVGIAHKSDVLSNVSGGIDHGTAWLGHTEISFGLNLDKLLGWADATALVTYHSNLGSKFNRNYISRLMGVDNIEVATNTAQFYQAWVQKNFLNDHVSALVGLYAIDTEFYTNEAAGLFLQPPYGMANEVAQAGENGPPVFPLGALGTRLKITSPDDNCYLQAAVTDGVPGDVDNPRGTHIKLGRGDGMLTMAEFGHAPKFQGDTKEPAEYFNKTAIGFWRYTTEFDAIDGSGSRRHNQGAYVLAERTLFMESGQYTQGLAGFVRLGVANKDVNQIDWSSSVGLRYRGLIVGRNDDVAGVAITVNHASDKYRHANNTDSAETDIEMTYRIQATPYLAVQPNVQLIKNPGMDPSLKDAWVLGARLEMDI